MTSAFSTGGSLRLPVLFGDSLTGAAQLNGAPEVRVAKSKSMYGMSGDDAVRPAVVGRLVDRPSSGRARPGRAPGSAALASGE